MMNQLGRFNVSVVVFVDARHDFFLSIMRSKIARGG